MGLETQHIVFQFIHSVLQNPAQAYTIYHLFNGNRTDGRRRRSTEAQVAVDLDTYTLLCEICEKKKRSRIEELRSVIKKEHDKIFDEAYEGVWD